MKWLKQWDVKSKKTIDRATGKLAEYRVSLGDDGRWECSCANWKFAKGGREDCKHILGIKLQIAYQEQPTKIVVANLNAEVKIDSMTVTETPKGRKFRD